MYYNQKGQQQEEDENDDDDAKEIDEEMSIIDAKVKEIEDFNKRDFKVDEDFMELFSDIYEKYDEEIVGAPFIEYNEVTPPPYYPLNGSWFGEMTS